MICTTELTVIAITMFVTALTTATRATAAADAPPSTGPAANRFACDLYAKLAGEAKRDENLFFSPFSVATALAMVTEGAREQTAIELATALHGKAAASPDAHGKVDLAPMHEALSTLATRLSGKPVAPGARQQIDRLTGDLDKANRKARESQKPWEDQRHAQEIADELNALLAQVDQYELRSANALWAERSFPIEKPYVDAIAATYRTGGLFPVDFRGDANGSRLKINAWVSEQTRDRINDLLAPEHVTPDTSLVLTNAVYFKGEWSDPFDAKETQTDAVFTLADGKTTARTALMSKRGLGVARYGAFHADGSTFTTPTRVPMGEVDPKSAYPDADGFQIVELPYKGGDLSMLVLLPRSADGLAALERNVTADNLATWSKELTRRDVNVWLPKFKLDTGYDMVRTLKSLGVKRAFVNPVDREGGAQFDGISASRDPRQRLYIGAVVHKAFVEVNEKGTEAAAATAISMAVGTAMPRDVPFTPDFRADHGFLFTIRDTAAGDLLFMGRFVRPAQ